MKEFWLFFTQQYLQWVQTNPNLVMNLSKVEGFLFGYGGYKTVTGRFHWGGSNLNEIVGTLIVQRLEISHGYCKPLILSPMLSGFYPCCCIKIALVSHQNRLQIQWSTFTSTFTQHSWWFSSETLPSFCLQVIIIFMSIPQISGYSVCHLLFSSWLLNNDILQDSTLRPFVSSTYTNSSRHVIQLHFCKHNSCSNGSKFSCMAWISACLECLTGNPYSFTSGKID